MENKIIVCRHGPAANGVTVTWAISQHHWVGARFEGKIYQICHCEEGKSGAPDVGPKGIPLGAISWYHSSIRIAKTNIVPGDCT